MTNLIVEPGTISTLRRVVRDGAAIQGGSFRLDMGPTPTETQTFLLASALYERCVEDGLGVRLSVIVNDLGLEPAKRPKATGSLFFPAEYLKILEDMAINRDDVLVFYESSLRNRVRKDGKAGKENRRAGAPVAVCANIMGKYYQELAELGFTQEIGFYAREPKPQDPEEREEDKACPYGPAFGAVEYRSGYPLMVDVVNYYVYPGGDIRGMCNIQRSGQPAPLV